MESNDRHHEIMATAAHLFRRQGYAACSIRQIGEALGTTSAALYYHFKNKDELLLGIMRMGLTVVHKAVLEAAKSPTGPEARLRAAVRAHLDVSCAYQDFAAVIAREMRHLDAASRKEVVRLRDDYEEVWDGLFREAQEAGVLRADVDLHLLRLMLFGALNNVLNWYRTDGAYTPEQIGNHYVDILLAGAGHPPAGANPRPLRKRRRSKVKAAT